MVGYTTEKNSFKLVIVVALLEEARPFIRQFKLQKWENSKLKAYQNGSLLLIVSGIGSTAITLAVGYAAAMASNSRRLFWLNLGSAGHRDYQIGTVVLPAEVRDSVSDLAFYPTPIIPGNFKRDKLRTLKAPSEKYVKNTCFDMEGYCFCAAASKFSIQDYVQVVKIISDNEQQPVSKLEKNTLKKAIAAGTEETIHIIEAFLDFARAEVKHLESSAPLPNTSKLHLTESQTIRLSKLISQIHLLDPSFDASREFEHHKTSASALNFLETKVRLWQSKIIND